MVPREIAAVAFLSVFVLIWISVALYCSWKQVAYCQLPRSPAQHVLALQLNSTLQAYHYLEGLRSAS